MAFLLLLPLGALLLTLIIKSRKPSSKLPPSPWKLPLIGNMLQLVGDSPPRILHGLSRKYGPIMHLKLGEVDHVIISSPEVAREILKTHDINFASRPQLIAPTILFDHKDLIFAPYGSYWRHLRKLCFLELLSARRVKSFRPIRECESLSLVSSIISKSAGKPLLVNLSEKLFLLSNTTTAHAAFGTESKQGPRFVSELKKAINLASGFNIADLYPSLSFLSRLLGMSGKLKKIRGHLYEILDQIIDEHKSRMIARNSTDEEAEDLLDVLLKLKDEVGQDFDLANVKAVILDIFAAGTETTGSTMIWVIAELVRHPAVMEKVQREVREMNVNTGVVEESDLEKMDYLKVVVKETLRLHPPTPLLVPRVCRETCNVMGYEIPEGSRVIINAWAIGREPRYWEDAESFVPERFQQNWIESRDNFHFLPFGGGRRICPGMGFGMANIELAIAHLLFHFDWQLPDGHELDMTEAFGATLTKKLDMWLIATPHFPLIAD